MAFKMNKPSITLGTSSYKSALKAKEDKESSEMMLDYSYNPDPKAKSYKDAYQYLDFKYPAKAKIANDDSKVEDYTKVDKYGREYKDDNTTTYESKEFETAAKAWNMKTYGTHNPTADAKKAGINKEELAVRFKSGGATDTKKSTKKAPDLGNITNVSQPTKERPGGGYTQTITSEMTEAQKAERKALQASDQKHVQEKLSDKDYRGEQIVTDTMKASNKPFTPKEQKASDQKAQDASKAKVSEAKKAEADRLALRGGDKRKSNRAAMEGMTPGQKKAAKARFKGEKKTGKETDKLAKAQGIVDSGEGSKGKQKRAQLTLDADALRVSKSQMKKINKGDAKKGLTSDKPETTKSTAEAPRKKLGNFEALSGMLEGYGKDDSGFTNISSKTDAQAMADMAAVMVRNSGEGESPEVARARLLKEIEEGKEGKKNPFKMRRDKGKFPYGNK